MLNIYYSNVVVIIVVVLLGSCRATTRAVTEACIFLLMLGIASTNGLFTLISKGFRESIYSPHFLFLFSISISFSSFSFSHLDYRFLFFSFCGNDQFGDSRHLLNLLNNIN